MSKKVKNVLKIHSALKNSNNIAFECIFRPIFMILSLYSNFWRPF